MVREANVKQSSAEKKFQETNGKVYCDILWEVL